MVFPLDERGVATRYSIGLAKGERRANGLARDTEGVIFDAA